jgi:hypothetical protein
MNFVLLISCNSELVVGGWLMPFKKIEIIGVDETRTYKPEDEKLLYNVYFELSLVPPEKWLQIFGEGNRSSGDTKRVWVDGRHIVAQCILKEVDCTLRDLKQQVATTNQKYKEFLQKKSLELSEKREN